MRARPPISRFAVFVVLAAALSLAACGRKAGLDLPPSASAAAAAPAPEKEETKSITSPIAKPPKPKPRVVPQRSLPIDFLLD